MNYLQIAVVGSRITKLRISRERDPSMLDVDSVPAIATGDLSRCYWDGAAVCPKREVRLVAPRTRFRADGVDEVEIAVEGAEGENFLVRVGSREIANEHRLQVTARNAGPIKVRLEGERIFSHPLYLEALEGPL